MEKKIILVTGATDGIGKAAVKALVKEGHKVIIHGRNSEKINKVILEIESQNKDTDVDLDYVVGDLLSFQQIKKMADELKQKYEYIDVLINNAGAVFDIERKLTEDKEERTLQLNVFSPFLLTQLLLPLLQKINLAELFLKALLLTVCPESLISMI